MKVRLTKEKPLTSWLKPGMICVLLTVFCLATHGCGNSSETKESTEENETRKPSQTEETVEATIDAPTVSDSSASPSGVSAGNAQGLPFRESGKTESSSSDSAPASVAQPTAAQPTTAQPTTAQPTTAMPPDSSAPAQPQEGTGLLSTKETISVRTILDGMVSAYRNAQTYRDRGEIRVSWTQNGNEHERRVVYRTTFQRPNRLLLEVNRTGVLADGSVLCAYTPEMPGLMLQKACPAELGFLDILCEREVYWSLTDVESNRFSYLPPPLVLLLAAKPLSTFLYQTEQADISLLSSETWEGHTCWRVSARREGEETIFWIDSASSVLRRVELPPQILQKESNNAVSADSEAMRVTLDFHDAELNWSGVLEMSAPASAIIVPSFMAPQMEILGRPLPDLIFTDLDGKKFTSKTFHGKPVFLFFWSVYESNVFNFHDVEEVFQKFRKDSRITFLGVNIDPLTVSNEKIQVASEKFGLTCPIARDETGNAAKMLRNGESFACFLIDAKGTVQFCDTLSTFHPTAHYAQNIQLVLEGKDIYQDRIHELRRAEQDYLESIRLWVENGIFLKEADTEQIAITEKKILPASEPVTFKKTELWTKTDLHGPTCLVPLPEKQRVLVLENGNCVTELDTDGQITDRRLLETPENEYFQEILATSPQSDGRRFFAAVGSRIYLFDDAWKPLTVYPPETVQSGQNTISDVLFDDLDDDGKPELYVTFWNDSGIRKIALDGSEIGAGSGVLNVFQMTAVRVNGKIQLRAVDQSGDISVFNPESMVRESVQQVPKRTISGLTAFDFDHDGTDAIAGISLGIRVRFKAVGLTPDGNEAWNIDLPNYTYQRKIEKIIPIEILNQNEVRGGWLLLGADSSIFMVEPSGILIDQFHFGKIITGCCSILWNDRPILLIASPESVTAYEIHR